jgi:hypothetical protein
MNKTNVPNFDKTQGLIIQARQLIQWNKVLNHLAWIMLDKEATRQNALLPENADGNDVWRGIDMDNCVVNDILDFFNHIK